MSVFLGVVMMLAFLIAVFVIFRGVSPIIVLLLLAIAWPLLAGSSFWDLLTNVLQKGGEQYASTIVIIVFGAWFGQVLVQTGIAESMIRTAVELAGDRPIAVAWPSRSSPRCSSPRSTGSAPRSRSGSSRSRSCSRSASRRRSRLPRSPWPSGPATT